MKAPVSGSMILAGVLLKLGGHGLLHVFPILPKYGFGFRVIWVVLRLVGGLFVNLFHMQQNDLKSLIAYFFCSSYKCNNWWYHNTVTEGSVDLLL